jgi:hypothetical protein
VTASSRHTNSRRDETHLGAFLDSQRARREEAGGSRGLSGVRGGCWAAAGAALTERRPLFLFGLVTSGAGGAWCGPCRADVLSLYVITQ